MPDDVQGLLFSVNGISRQCARFEPEGDTWRVTDLVSSHGTLVNDVSTRDGGIVLQDGDELRLGEFIRFRFSAG